MLERAPCQAGDGVILPHPDFLEKLYKCHFLSQACLGYDNQGTCSRLLMGEMGQPHAEGATTPETLRQKDHSSAIWREANAARRRDNTLRQKDRWGQDSSKTATGVCCPCNSEERRPHDPT